MGTTKFALLAGTLLASTALLAAPAMAASKTRQPTNQELLERIEQLEQEVKESKESQGTRITVLEDNAKAVSWSYDNGRPTIKSGDGRFELSLRARFQADAASFMQDDDLPAAVPAAARDLGSGAVIRRAYFGIEGKVFKDFLYEFRLNFGGSNAEGSELNLARIAYVGIPNFRINAGVIQPIFTLGDTTSSGQLTFIEKPAIVNVATGAFGGSDARRGLELTYQKSDFLYSGDNFVLSGAFTGAKTGTAAAAGGHASPGDEQTQLLGRLAYRLWSDGTSNIQVGGSGATILHRNPTTGPLSISNGPEMSVTNSSLVSTGDIANVDGGHMWGVDGGANFKNFYVAGEYHNYTFDRSTPGAESPEFSGWYVEGSWILTGEAKGYSASAKNNEMGAFGMPKVIKPFSLSGHSWGAWEIAARYSTLDLNWNDGIAGGIAGGEQEVLAIGLNWYLNNNIRLMIHDMIVDVDRRASPGSATQIGQDLNIIGGRFQFQM
jgi:phosphate-selective porin OprO/OprP